MVKTLVFATNNEHKLNEVRQMIGDEFHLKSLNDLACHDDIPETGATFEENASLKSEYVYHRYKIDCFADDSGLEVEALNHEPGVYSARYSGGRDPETNLQLVLDRLGNEQNRRARFRCVISLIVDGKNHLFEGAVEGTIRLSKSGADGFGYDPIFQPNGYDVTFAEMDMAEKNRISHRGKAMQKLVAFLKREAEKQ